MCKTTGVTQDCPGETFPKDVNTVCGPLPDDAGRAGCDLIYTAMGKAFVEQVQSKDYISTYSFIQHQPWDMKRWFPV